MVIVKDNDNSVLLANSSKIPGMRMKISGDILNDLKLTSNAKVSYLTLTAVEDNTTFHLFKRANPNPNISRDVDLWYSFDDGETWTKYTMPAAGQNGASVSIPKGKSVLLKGNNPDGFNDCYFNNGSYISNIVYYI